MRHGSLIQNIVVNICEKFYYDRLRNGRALGNLKYDNNNLKKKHSNNNNNNNNVGSARGTVCGPKIKAAPFMAYGKGR